MATTYQTIDEARQANYEQAAQHYAQGGPGPTRYVVALHTETGEYLAGGIDQIMPDDDDLRKALAKAGNELVEITTEAPVASHRTRQRAAVDAWYEAEIAPHLAPRETPEAETSKTCRHGVAFDVECSECDAECDAEWD